MSNCSTNRHISCIMCISSKVFSMAVDWRTLVLNCKTAAQCNHRVSSTPLVQKQVAVCFHNVLSLHVLRVCSRLFREVLDPEERLVAVRSSSQG